MTKELGYIEETKYLELSRSYEILGKQLYRLKETWTKKSDI